MIKFFTWNWDAVGFSTSLLCALHCILMPLILALGVFTNIHWITHPLIEWALIGASIGIASWSLLQSYFYMHQNIRPLFIAGLGFLGLFIAQTIATSSVHWIMAIGGTLIAYAHVYNWRLAHRPKTETIRPRRSITLGRITVIIFLLLYFLGLRGACVHDNTPPSREEILQAVWRVQH